MSRPSKAVPSTLDEDYKMPAVSNPTKLSGKYIGGTSGKDYSASIAEAYEWASRRDKDEKFPFYTILVDYYPQVMGHKSILFSFNLVPKSDATVKE